MAGTVRDTWKLLKKDRQVVGVALTLLTKAIDNAVGSLKAIGCESFNVVTRLQDLEALNDLLYDAEQLKGDQDIPLDLCPTLRVGLSLQHDAVQAVKKNKLKLELETDEEEVRDKQLSRILSDLDVNLIRLAPRDFDLAVEVAKTAALKLKKKSETQTELPVGEAKKEEAKPAAEEKAKDAPVKGKHDGPPMRAKIFTVEDGGAKNGKAPAKKPAGKKK